MDTFHKVQEILEAALDDAFVAPKPSLPIPIDTPQPTMAQAASGDSREPSLEGSGSDDDEAWKEQYETQVRGWRAQSAQQREKAEKERLRWETIRAQEKEEALAEPKNVAVGLSVQESWEKLGASDMSFTTTSEDRSRAEPIQGATSDDMHKCENEPSLASSLPSILPDTPAPSQPTEPPPTPSVSVTLSIFDSSLSTRTRLLALASSLAMNLFLPFVNGVMLGFGEIFARHVVTAWFGWNIANIGLRTNPWRR